MNFTFIEEFTKEQNDILQGILIKDKIVVKTPEQIKVYKMFIELINKDLPNKS